MFDLTPDVKETIRLARQTTILNAWQLLQTAVGLFENNQYSTTCFLAMTSIEELGKLFILQMVQGDVIRGLSDLDLEAVLPEKFDSRNLKSFLRNHLEKAVQAAATSLYINSGADQRHGVDHQSNITRTSGVILLARSGRWKTLRSNCLYTDINFDSKTTSSPVEVISREHAYYFICMGFEILAEQAEAGLGSIGESPNVVKSTQFWQDRRRELESFIVRWSSTVNLDKLDFLANPDSLREDADNGESRTARRK